MICAATISLVCLFVQVLSAPETHLDVFVSRNELKKFFPDFNIDFYIIRKGVVNGIFLPLMGYLPVIAPSIQTLELNMRSRHKMYYKLYLSSSDKSLMRTPSANMKTSGQVPRKTRPLKIRFPCNGHKSGEATLSIRMEFMVPSRKKIVVTKFLLKVKRKCKKVFKHVELLHKPNYICEKQCDRGRVSRRFCIADFAIRARVESVIEHGGRMKYRVRVNKRYKTRRVKIFKRHIIEIRGSDITCDCTPLKVHKTYLLLGKENKRTNSLVLDRYTFAIEWSQGGKKLAKLHRKRKNDCPRQSRVKWHR